MNVLTSLMGAANGVLRGASAGDLAIDRPSARAAGPGALVVLIVVFGMLYGGVMGAYGDFGGARALQVLHSALKVPLLLVATFALGLPSFFVINTLLGLRRDFGRAVRALLATQAGLTVVLSSLAPFTGLWYVSGSGYHEAILFNGAMFAVASFSGQWLLRRAYAPLIREAPRHRWMLWAWIVIYVFVGIQMGWVLRPFIGDPGAPVEFFRSESWSNAYEAVFQIVANVLGTRGGGP